VVCPWGALGPGRGAQAARAGPSYRVLARRKPRSSCRRDGSLPNRHAERQWKSSPFQQPQWITPVRDLAPATGV